MTKLVRLIDDHGLECFSPAGGVPVKGFVYEVEEEGTEILRINGLWWEKSRFEVVEIEQPSPLNTQVGGSHYKDMPIQPLDYIVKNNLGFCEGNVVKYVSRYKAKGGVEDLKKARHYLDVLIGLEEGAE